MQGDFFFKFAGHFFGMRIYRKMNEGGDLESQRLLVQYGLIALDEAFFFQALKAAPSRCFAHGKNFRKFRRGGKAVSLHYTQDF